MLLEGYVTPIMIKLFDNNLLNSYSLYSVKLKRVK